MLDYIWLIPILPLAGSALIGLSGLIKLRYSGNKLSKKVVTVIALGSVGLAFLLSIVLAYQLFVVEHEEIFSKDFFTWIQAGSLPLPGFLGVSAGSSIGRDGFGSSRSRVSDPHILYRLYVG